jgi:mannose-6-phosphate isomerase-like protein (cupin superfamily)
MFEIVRNNLESQGFHIANSDEHRPWGGFFVIDENQAQDFVDLYFKGISIDDIKISGKLSPKILLVAPTKRLSWQYHHRRAEIWRVVSGEVEVETSFTDEPENSKILNAGDQIELACGERHRLIGLNDWAIVAEIWRHTEANHPSDELDIVRLQDDFQRQ